MVPKRKISFYHVEKESAVDGKERSWVSVQCIIFCALVLFSFILRRKTSMRSIIFANYMARDTMRIAPTLGIVFFVVLSFFLISPVDVEHTHVRFMGNLVLNLWDCGGQYRFYESYFDSQRDTIFRNVEVLIYVFDIESSELDNDLTLFDGVIEAMEQNSPDAAIFVLIHKMDLVAEDERDKLFKQREKVIMEMSQQ